MFRLLAKGKSLQPYITQKDFVTSNNFPEIITGFDLYVFDICHHQEFSSAQLIKLRLDFKPPVEAATNLIGYAPLLTKEINSIGRDGQRQFELI